MKHDDMLINLQLRRQFIIGTAAFVAGIRPLSVVAKSTADTITVDLHSHAFLDADDMNGLNTSTGPDVTFLSGHPFLGPLPTVLEEIKKYKLTVAQTYEDIIRAKSHGQRVVMIANEGGDFLGGDLSKLEEMHARGLVSMQLVRAASYGIVDNDDNLTALGRDVIRTQNRLGMIVDLAHAKERTIEQAVEVSTRPVMLSHMNKRVDYLWDIVVQTGGIIGNWWSPRAARLGMTFDDWIDGFASIADAVGVDAVGVQTELGTGVHRGPFDSYMDWNTIGQALLQKGFSREETDKILGGNFMRMFAKITAGKG